MGLWKLTFELPSHKLTKSAVAVSNGPHRETDEDRMEPKVSFGARETLTITIPGYYFLAMFYLYVGALNRQWLQGLGGEVGLFLFLIIGLAVGFVFFTFNWPNRRKAYNTGQPSEYLWQMSSSSGFELNKKRSEHIQLYLYILNNFLPSTFHEVIIVRGGLYFCITYVWLISLIWFVVGGLTVVVLSVLKCTSVALPFGPGADSRPLLLAYSIFQFVIFACLFFPKRVDRIVQVLYYDQIEWMKLNERLVVHLLREREDPRVHEFFTAAGERNSDDGENAG